MKLVNSLLLALFVGTLLLNPVSIQAQDKMSKEDMQKMMEEMGGMDEMMMKWQAAATPGENHKKLDWFVGEWNASSKMWMGGPDTPPMETKGTVKYEMIFGGRYLQGMFSGEMMPGMMMEGRSITGYDNIRKKYFGSWMDNMSTQVGTMSGVYDPKNNAYVMYGEMDEPMTGEIGKPVKYVWKIKDPNTYIFEVHDSVFGLGNTMVMEMTCKRK